MHKTLSLGLVLLAVSCGDAPSELQDSLSISGRVSGEVRGGVLVTLSGDAESTAVTDAAGAYLFADLQSGFYTITPTLPDYEFSPATISVSLVDSSISERNFTATHVSTTGTHTISGSISGDALFGVELTLSGAGSAVTHSDADGYYEFSGLEDGSYTITPALANHSFSPQSRQVTIAGANVVGGDFTATSITEICLDGPIPSGGCRCGEETHSDGHCCGGVWQDSPCGGCVDPCPSPYGGVVVDCRQRFMYGVNYAWKSFAGDFGGIAGWGVQGVSGRPEVYAADLNDMSSNGIGTVRWWVFPDFRGSGVLFDADDNPTGITATTVADVHKALELAHEADLHLMLTLFSFDNFRPTHTDGGILIRGLQPMIVDASRRLRVIENVVRPLAQAVASSPHADRLVAWNIINEPEWAMSGTNPYGDPAYEPAEGMQTVTHAQMETFIREVIAELRAHGDHLISVGGAAVKWAKAWSNVDTDFHQFHIYEWVNNWFPYYKTPADYGVDDKPVVIGEFPVRDAGLGAGITYTEVVETLYEVGYAGAMSWQYTATSEQQLANIAAFGNANSCETRF